MKKKTFILITSILLAFACKHKNGQNNQKDDSIANDSINVSKYQLKESIISHSFNMPYSIIGTSDTKSHSQTDYFKVLDSLILLYEKKPLTNREKKLLSIFKTKKYFVLSEYSNGIKELKKLPEKGEFEEDKKTLLAILYGYKGDSVMSQTIFKELLSDFKGLDENAETCARYYVLKILSGSTEYNQCQDFIGLYKREKVDKAHLIINNILTPINL